MHRPCFYLLYSNSMGGHTLVYAIHTLSQRRRYSSLAETARQHSFLYFLDSRYYEAVHTSPYAVVSWDGGTCALNMGANLVGQSVP
jgi:hypothetical protein